MAENPAKARARRAAKFTDSDRAILNELENAHGDGLVLGSDLALLIGVPSKAIGARLTALRGRGLVESRIYPNASFLKGWQITQQGIDGGPWHA